MLGLSSSIAIQLRKPLYQGGEGKKPQRGKGEKKRMVDTRTLVARQKRRTRLPGTLPRRGQRQGAGAYRELENLNFPTRSQAEGCVGFSKEWRGATWRWEL
jgi:hypothetical protein